MMMKKWLAGLAALMLLIGCAHAEAIESLHISKDGFILSYPQDTIRIEEQYGHDLVILQGENADSDASMLIVPAEIALENIEVMLAEAVGGFGPDAVIGEAEIKALESGMTIGMVQAASDGVVYRYYLIHDGEYALCVTATLPEQEADAYIAQMEPLVEAIRFVPVRTAEAAAEEGAESVTEAQYTGEGFTLWYPVGVIEPRVRYAHDGFAPAGSGAESEVFLMIVKTDVPKENADSLLNEAVGGYEGDYAVSEVQEKTLENGLTIRSIEAEQGDKVDRYYLVIGDEAVYCVTASFPAVSEIDYRSVFDGMMETFELAEVK